MKSYTVLVYFQKNIAVPLQLEVHASSDEDAKDEAMFEVENFYSEYGPVQKIKLIEYDE